MIFLFVIAESKYYNGSKKNFFSLLKCVVFKICHPPQKFVTLNSKL